jgi:hypothetical protein
MGAIRRSLRGGISSVTTGVMMLGVIVCIVVARPHMVQAITLAQVVGREARNVSITEKATLRLVGRPGHILNERGSVSGTYNGTCEARFVRITNRTGEARVTVFMSGGSLTATAKTRAHNPEGAIASYTGTAAITDGSGTWRNASGNLTLSGMVDRQNFHATAEVRGSLHV